MTVRVSVTLPQFHPSGMAFLPAAARAGELGYDGVFVFDHLYPLDGPQRPIMEGITALGAVAAVATTDRIGTLVLRAPTRPAWTNAKSMWSAQAISGGRMVVGIGAADSMSRGEMEAYGLPFGSLEERLRQVRETVEALDAPELALLGVTRPPVWIAGRLPALRRLAAEVAEGWNVWGGEPARLAEEAAETRSWANGPFTVSWGGVVLLAPDRPSLEAALARRGSRKGVIAGVPEEVAEQLAAFVEAGADELVLSLLPSDEPEASWRLFAERVRPLLG